MPTFAERMIAAGIPEDTYREWQVSLEVELKQLRAQREQAIATRQAATAQRDACAARINEIRQILDGVNEP